MLGACVTMACAWAWWLVTLGPVRRCLTRSEWTASDEANLMRASEPLPRPLFLARHLMAIGAFVSERLPNRVVPPPMRMEQLCYSSYVTWHVISAVIALDVAEALGGGPLTAEQLAAAVGVPEAELLGRAMRALCVQGIFAEAWREGSEEGSPVVQFRNNALSATLRGDHPNSMKGMWVEVAHIDGPPWGGFAEQLRGGGAAFNAHYDVKSMWDYLMRDPAREAMFSAAMDCRNRRAHPFGRALAEDFPWSRYRRLVDIGGSNGSFFHLLATADDEIHGVVVDRPEAVEQATKEWAAADSALAGSIKGGAGRIEFIAGDFFASEPMPIAPKPGTLYALRHILHDWNDASSLQILQNVRLTVARDPGASLAIVEMVLPSPRQGASEGSAAFIADLHMAMVHGARERSRKQWTDLLRQAGFAAPTFHPTRGLLNVITTAPLTA